MGFPQDTDGDKLPNAWEAKQEFWPAVDTADPTKGHGAKKKYDPNAAKTAGVLDSAANDGASDQDLDSSATPVHAVFGDGISAFDEYRGLRVQGVVKRFDQLTDDGPIGGNGGTAVKDAFVFDEKPRNVELLRSANDFLKALGILWHKIKKEEMKAGKKTAGKINFNGENDQNGIWLANVNLQTGDFGRSTLKVSDGAQVAIDLRAVRKANYSQGLERKVIDWIVAHELAHKLTIKHPPSRVLAFSATEEADTSKDVYYFATPDKNQPVRKKEVQSWVPVSQKEAKRPALEFPEPREVGGVNAQVKKFGKVDDVGDITRHNEDHLALELITELAADADTSKTLKLFAHKGFLNDHAPEIAKFQDKLDTADKAKPDLTK